MKYVATTAAIATAVAMSGTAANAGSLAPMTDVDPVVVEDQPMGSGSASWIVPLLAIGVIALVVSQDDDDTPAAPGPTPPTPGPTPPTPGPVPAPGPTPGGA